MHTWFEVILTIYGFIYLCLIGGCFESEPELSEEMPESVKHMYS